MISSFKMYVFSAPHTQILLFDLSVSHSTMHSLSTPHPHSHSHSALTQLLNAGYPCLSLHGGKDQVDRDHTLHEFKTGIKTVLVATSVAGRGLDVPDIVCVINFNAPNHIEDYVHRVGRTGRAGRKGTAYTFLSPQEEQYTSVCIKALERAGLEVPVEVRQMHDAYSLKVDRGEAKAINSYSGFSGKGFTFDAEEMNEQQKIQALQKKAYEREQGIVSTTGEEDELLAGDDEGPTNVSLTGLAPHMVVMLEKAQSIASAISVGKTPLALPSLTPSAAVALPCLLPDGSIDAKAALQRAKAIWVEVLRARQGAVNATEAESGASGAGSHFSEEFDINDYPPLARRKITSKATLDDVIERTAVNIIQRGSYVAPNKKPEATDKRLHLLIEGTSELAVKKAKNEILRLLEEETLRGVGSAGSAGGGGRYNVL